MHQSSAVHGNLWYLFKPSLSVYQLFNNIANLFSSLPFSRMWTISWWTRLSWISARRRCSTRSGARRSGSRSTAASTRRWRSSPRWTGGNAACTRSTSGTAIKRSVQCHSCVLQCDTGTGADPGFHLGGAQKIMCPHAHYERRTELTFGRGPGPA